MQAFTEWSKWVDLAGFMSHPTHTPDTVHHISLYHVQVTIWSGPSVLGGWCSASSWQRTASPSISQLQNMRRSLDPAPLYLRTLWRYTNAVIIIIIRTVLATETFLLPDLESGTICHRNCDTRISALGNSETCWNRVSLGFSQPWHIVTFLLLHFRTVHSYSLSYIN